jgi:hypothetical protein
MFVAVEAIAGVEHVEGRAFYGLRRQATDLAPEFASDARVLNRLSGHLDSATRERVYQEKENQRVRARGEGPQAQAQFLPSRTGRTWTTPREPIPKPIPPGKDERKPRQRKRCRGFTWQGAPGEIRTPGLLIRSQTLYPAELRAHVLPISLRALREKCTGKESNLQPWD